MMFNLSVALIFYLPIKYLKNRTKNVKNFFFHFWLKNKRYRVNKNLFAWLNIFFFISSFLLCIIRINVVYLFSRITNLSTISSKRKKISNDWNYAKYTNNSTYFLFSNLKNMKYFTLMRPIFRDIFFIKYLFFFSGIMNK